MESNNEVGNTMQQYKEKRVPEAVIGSVKQFSSKAAAIAGDQLGRVADMTEVQVKKYPLAAVGVALGSGIVLGTLGTILLTPRREPTLMERIGELDLGARLLGLYKKLF